MKSIDIINNFIKSCKDDLTTVIELDDIPKKECLIDILGYFNDPEIEDIMETLDGVSYTLKALIDHENNKQDTLLNYELEDDFNKSMEKALVFEEYYNAFVAAAVKLN